MVCTSPLICDDVEICKSVRPFILLQSFICPMPSTFVILFIQAAFCVMAMTGKELRFNVSWLASGHPVLDAAKLISEANRLFTSLLDMLQSSSSLPGQLTITIVNW